MSEQFPTCQDIFLTVPAGEEAVRAGNAEMLAIISATASFEIAFDSGSFQLAQPGLSYQGRADVSGRRPRFAQLRFKNPNAFPIDILVQVSNGDIFDNRAIFGAGSVPIIFAPSQVYLPRARVPNVVSDNLDVSVAAGGSTSIYNANADRAAVVLYHLGTEMMFLTSSSGSSNRGIPLAPGERLTLEVNGDLRARNPAAFSQTIRRTEIVWS